MTIYVLAINCGFLALMYTSLYLARTTFTKSINLFVHIQLLGYLFQDRPVDSALDDYADVKEEDYEAENELGNESLA